MSHHYRIAAAGLLAALAAVPAGAQQRYYCEGPRGQVITSTTPCPTGGGIGSAAVMQQQGGASPGPYAAQGSRRDDYLQYMSGRCQDLQAAMRRTEPTISPSASYQRVREARQRYDELCSEEEAEARRRIAEDARDGRRAKFQADIQARAETITRERNEAASREQCIESKRVLAARKARTDLNEGERKDLARFEENVRQRCPLGN